MPQALSGVTQRGLIELVTAWRALLKPDYAHFTEGVRLRRYRQDLWP